METIVLEGQSLLDIAIQTGGSVECIFDLAVRNNISITDSLQAGQVLDSPTIVNKQIADYYRQRNIHPATAPRVMEEKIGIGNWVIGVNFQIN